MGTSRKFALANNNVYHIVSRSIAGYKIFNIDREYLRFLDILNYYKCDIPYKFSDFKRLSIENQEKIFKDIFAKENNYLVHIIAYCIMPTHIHLILEQMFTNGISIYMNKLLNSYTRYFNTIHNRKGPLWESRFKNILIDSDELLLHVTRYNHLNPTSVGLVKNPQDWLYSSYNEYLKKTKITICNFKDRLDIDPAIYKKFVDDRIKYQKEISKIKALLLEDYTG